MKIKYIIIFLIIWITIITIIYFSNLELWNCIDLNGYGNSVECFFESLGG